MRCVVTGAAGFVGSTLCDRLLADGHEVIGFDCFTDYYPRAVKERNLAAARTQSRFSFQEGNLLTADLNKLLTGAEWVFHQAAQAGVRKSWGEYFDTYTSNNVLGTQRLLEAARVTPTIKKVVYASSSSIYGNAESFPTKESATPTPVSPYGVTKLAAEHLMCLYASQFGVPTTSLRYFTVYGPRHRPDMGFYKFIAAALRDRPLGLYGDGEQSRDFTFIDDIVSANVLAAQKGAPGSVFNIGGGSQVTVNQIFAIIGEVTGKTLQIKSGPKQPGDARHTGADTTLARTALGYAPVVSLKEGLAREAQWLSELLKRGEIVDLA